MLSPAAVADSLVASGEWKVAQDKNSQRTYFFNVSTKERVWNLEAHVEKLGLHLQKAGAPKPVMPPKLAPSPAPAVREQHAHPGDGAKPAASVVVVGATVNQVTKVQVKPANQVTNFYPSVSSWHPTYLSRKQLVAHLGSSGISTIAANNKTPGSNTHHEPTLQDLFFSLSASCVVRRAITAATPPELPSYLALGTFRPASSTRWARGCFLLSSSARCTGGCVAITELVPCGSSGVGDLLQTTFGNVAFAVTSDESASSMKRAIALIEIDGGGCAALVGAFYLLSPSPQGFPWGLCCSWAQNTGESEKVLASAATAPAKSSANKIKSPSSANAYEADACKASATSGPSCASAGAVDVAALPAALAAQCTKAFEQLRHCFEEMKATCQKGYRSDSYAAQSEVHESPHKRGSSMLARLRVEAEMSSCSSSRQEGLATPSDRQSRYAAMRRATAPQLSGPVKTTVALSSSNVTAELVMELAHSARRSGDSVAMLAALEALERSI